HIVVFTLLASSNNYGGPSCFVDAVCCSLFSCGLWMIGCTFIYMVLSVFLNTTLSSNDPFVFFTHRVYRRLFPLLAPVEEITLKV
ncbi:hypothetical protein LINPERHAP1_LOCUS9744, partial [Linum perenne]